VNRFLWDKSLKTSAVPPKLTIIVRSAMCQHTSFLGNGGKARRRLLTMRRSARPRQSIQPSCFCCTPTSGSSLKETYLCLLVCVIGFVRLNLGKVYSVKGAVVNP